MAGSNAMTNASQRFGAASSSSPTASRNITGRQPSNQGESLNNTIVASIIHQSTPSGSSDVSSICSTTDDQVRKLQMMNARLLFRNNELQDSTARQRKHTGGRGKNATVKADRSYTMTDLRNKGYVSTWVSTTLMRHVKVLPIKWMKYSNHKGSICQRIFAIANVEIPVGMEKQKYWDDVLADLTNSLMGSYRSNRVQGHSKQYGGNYFAFVFQIYIFIINNLNMIDESTNTSCFQT